MAIKPIRPPSVELRCVRNDSGSFKAGAYCDGSQLQDVSKYTVQNGTCDDIRRIHRQLRKDYPGVPIIVNDSCADCIIDDEEDNEWVGAA